MYCYFRPTPYSSHFLVGLFFVVEILLCNRWCLQQRRSAVEYKITTRGRGLEPKALPEQLGNCYYCNDLVLQRRESNRLKLHLSETKGLHAEAL